MELSPDIYNFSKQNHCIESFRHYSSSHTTAYGAFSFLYGLNPYYLEQINMIDLEPLPLSVFRSNNYLSYGVVASNLNLTKATGNLRNYFDKYKNIKGKGVEKDRKLVDWIKKEYKNHDPDRNYFFFAFLNSTHHNYFYPPEFERYKPVVPENYNHFASAGEIKENSAEIFNRYKNSVLYINHLFGELIEIFKKDIEDDNLVVVLTGDHGEEFWDDGSLGHGKTKFINARVQVPLLFCLPGKEKIKVQFSQHVDIVPTVIDYLMPEFDFSHYLNGHSLIREIPDGRYVFSAGHGFPYKNRKFMLASKDGKMILNKTNDTISMSSKFEIVEQTTFDDEKRDETTYAEKEVLKKFKKDMLLFFYE
jgi:hypothetical protein